MNIDYSIEKCSYGFGIFTNTFIPRGTCIWFYKLNSNVIEFDENNTLKYLDTLSKNQAIEFLDMSYGRNDKLCLILDDGKYMNHMNKPYNNCKSDPITGHTYAIRDIYTYEQLYEDYSDFDHPYFLNYLLTKYNCKPDYYELGDCVSTQNLKQAVL